MSSMYHAGQRTLQDRFDTRRLADRLEEVKTHAELSDADVQFIAARDMLFLATCDPSGHTVAVAAPCCQSGWTT